DGGRPPAVEVHDRPHSERAGGAPDAGQAHGPAVGIRVLQPDVEPVVAAEGLLEQRVDVEGADHPAQRVGGALGGTAQRHAAATERALEQSRVQPCLVDRLQQDTVSRGGGPQGRRLLWADESPRVAPVLLEEPRNRMNVGSASRRAWKRTRSLALTTLTTALPIPPTSRCVPWRRLYHCS